MNPSRTTLAFCTALSIAALCCLAFAGASRATDTNDQTFDMNANGFAAFELFTPFGGQRPRALGVTRTATGTLQASQHLTYVSSEFVGATESSTPRVATDDDGGVTFAWIRGGNVQFRQRQPNGTLTDMRTAFAATADTDADGLRIGTDGAGNVTLAWAQVKLVNDTDEQYRVMTRRIAPNGTLGPLQAVSPVYLNDSTFGRRVLIDVNAADTALFAWRHGAGELSARLRTHGGTFTAEQLVDPATGGSFGGTPFDISLDEAGNAYYAWTEGFPDDGNTGVTIKASTRRAANGAQTAEQTIATDTLSFEGAFTAGGQFAIDSDAGRATVIFTRNTSTATTTVVGARTLTAAGVLGANRSIAPGSNVLPVRAQPDVSVAPNGGVGFSFASTDNPFAAAIATLTARTAPDQTGAISAPVTVYEGTSVGASSLERRSTGHVLFRFLGFGGDASGCLVRVLRPTGTLTALQSYGTTC